MWKQESTFHKSKLIQPMAKVDPDLSRHMASSQSYIELMLEFE